MEKEEDDAEIPRCKVHPSQLMIVQCPVCLASIRTKKKAKSSAENGAKGGRPKKVLP